jgi:hypothetical protein
MEVENAFPQESADNNEGHDRECRESGHNLKRKFQNANSEVLKKSKKPDSSIQDEAMTNIFDSIEKKIARECSKPQNKNEIEKYEITSLLQSIHFERLMNNIGHMDECTNIPLVTKTYEEKFMRGSIYQHEKSCIMDYQCECMFIDDENPFVGTRFCLPNSEESDGGMCVLCIRKSTQLLFYHTINKGITPLAPIQKYGNICGQPGEYHVSAMLLCPPNGPVHCMPLPVVAHQRNRYSVYKNAGIPYIKQKKVAFEDF